jgi:hypothetical protein
VQSLAFRGGKFLQTLRRLPGGHKPAQGFPKSQTFGRGQFTHIIYNQTMKTNVRLNAKILPLIAVGAFIMQILDPSRVWVILLTGIGGAWVVCWWWTRGLVRSLHFER